jgi:protein-S-isoprenylcysteine O-methyltransferase Ste14
MTSQANMGPKDWQQRAWVQLLAILIGVGLTYIPTIISHLRSDLPISMKGVFLYSTILGSIMIIVMLLLLKYLCGESIRDLNRKPGRWWKDILVGIGLTVLTLGVLLLLQNPLNSIFPREPDSGLGDFFNELVRDPLLFGLIMGLGLIHIYQGPAGVISTGISGLILAVYYHYFGRVIPMMLSHYLHNAIQFAAIYIMANLS